MSTREPFHLLQVRGLAKRFGGLQVFNDVSFELTAGSVMGVIGPNGAGKTTLINVISGVISPSAGMVELNGRNVAGRPVHALSRMGVIRSFQQTNTFRSETVRENLRRAIRFSGGGAAAWQDIEDLLVEFELDSVLDERSDKLPYGLQKMLGLLMAFLARPSVLLLDEPAAGLERSERTRVDRLVQVARERIGCSVLIVEHDMDLVKRLCPSILVLDGGVVIAEGAPADVLSRRSVINAYVGASEEDAQ